MHAALEGNVDAGDPAMRDYAENASIHVLPFQTVLQFRSFSFNPKLSPPSTLTNSYC